MDNLRAAVLRPQLRQLDRNIERWHERYRAVERELQGTTGLRTPYRLAQECFVGSSIQFQTAEANRAAAHDFLARCRARGVELKWFGADEPHGYTSRHDSWHYVVRQELPQTDAILTKLFDMRVPLTFSVEDCQLIGRILAECHAETMARKIAS